MLLSFYFYNITLNNCETDIIFINFPSFPVLYSVLFLFVCFSVNLQRHMRQKRTLSSL